MGYFEATVLFWCPREYDFKSLATQLEDHTKVTRLVHEPVPEALGYLREAREGEQIDRLASLYLRDWYKLPPSEGIQSVFCDDEDSKIILY
jgi:hypothetical protein